MVILKINETHIQWNILNNGKHWCDKKNRSETLKLNQKF